MNLNPSTQVRDIRSCWIGRGRGWSEALCFDGCICFRPYFVVLCHYCGFHCRGRLRIQCRDHPNVNFLTDLDHCPKCKVQQVLMSECRIEDYAKPADVFPPVLPEKCQKQQDAFNSKIETCCTRANREKYLKHGRQ